MQGAFDGRVRETIKDTGNFSTSSSRISGDRPCVVPGADPFTNSTPGVAKGAERSSVSMSVSTSCLPWSHALRPSRGLLTQKEHAYGVTRLTLLSVYALTYTVICPIHYGDSFRTFDVPRAVFLQCFFVFLRSRCFVT